MADLRVVVSENEKSFQKVLSPEEAASLFGLKLGKEIDGKSIGLEGYKLKLTGGTDKNGFPMRKELDVEGKRRVLLAGGVGMRSKGDGVRRKKMVHGSHVGDDIAQLNLKVLEAGKTPLQKLMGGESSEKESESA